MTCARTLARCLSALGFLAFGLPAVGLLGLTTGCTPEPESSTPATAESGGPAGKPVVALVVKDLSNEFFQTMIEGAEEHAAANADRYTLKVDGLQNEQDLNRQVAIVSQLVAEGVDAIVLAPADSKGLVPAVQKALEAGVPVINIDNKLDADKLAAAGIAVPFIGPDNRAGARRVGEYAATKLPPDATVAILEGIPTAFNAIERRAGFEEAMGEAGLTVVDVQSAEWDLNKAGQVSTAMLSAHDGLGAILASNDTMALGALAAAKSQGRDDLVVVGFDNNAAAQEAIRDGRLLATADQQSGLLATEGIDAALAAIAGQSVDDRQTAVELVTAETLAADSAAAPEEASP